MGLLDQVLVTALKDELTKYYGMIAMLQEQFNRSKQYDSAEQITLMKVMLWLVEPMHRLRSSSMAEHSLRSIPDTERW